MEFDEVRTRKLAKLVVRYCVDVKPNENVVIVGSSGAEDFIKELHNQIILAEANPLIRMYPKGMDYFYFKHANKKQLTDFPRWWYDAIKKSNNFIEVLTEFNTCELSSCNPKKIELRESVLSPISEYIESQKEKMKYVLVSYPCAAHAQEADMSFDEWQDFVFSSCLIDWKKFAKKYNKINKVFEKGKDIHLIGENVDLKFSVRKKNSMLDNGKENMPGGELYMSPNKKSLNGWIRFEFPSIYNGKEISEIYLEFKDGRVVKYDAKKNKKMLKFALESDKNAKYIGEFGIGVNPNIKKLTNNLMFDEKISGTIHLALGNAYIENGGGNDSVIHWDIIKDMRKAKIILDGKVVQENGKWKV